MASLRVGPGGPRGGFGSFTCFATAFTLLTVSEGYSPFSVARFFIEKGFQSGNAITPMKLIKLVYIAHGWNLGLLDSPLIYEPVQAWQYGPVIESLYHGFKIYGNNPIPVAEATKMPDGAKEFDAISRSLMEKIWEKYSPVPATQLSALTHQPGTPWYTVWEQQGGKDRKRAIIPDTLIRDFYKQKFQTKQGSGH